MNKAAALLLALLPLALLPSGPAAAQVPIRTEEGIYMEVTNVKAPK